MENLIVIEWVATVLSVIGAVLVAFHKRIGFFIWIISNGLWVFFAYQNKHKVMMVLFIIYILTSLKGLIHKPKNKKEINFT